MDPAQNAAPSSVGEIAYNAYGAAVGWKTVSGSAMPPWSDQRSDLQEAWSAAAIALCRDVHGRYLTARERAAGVEMILTHTQQQLMETNAALTASRADLDAERTYLREYRATVRAVDANQSAIIEELRAKVLELEARITQLTAARDTESGPQG